MTGQPETVWSAHATDASSLANVSGAVHDAYMTSDPRWVGSDVVVLPIAQEGWAGGPAPDREHVAGGWLRRDELVAFHAGQVRIGHVTRFSVPEDWDGSEQLLGIRYDADFGEVRVHAAGGKLIARVSALCIQVSFAAQVAFRLRRRTYPLLRASIDRGRR